jgi:NADH:ubiquinone oxidoreductase subunit 2 (subunit N)
MSSDPPLSGSHDLVDGPATHTICDPPPLRSAQTPADRFMRRLLRLPLDGPTASADDARKAFQTSIAVATVRCLLMYIVFPFVLPAIGVAKGVGPVVGLVISVVAIVAISMSIRRFWRADHSKRWHYTVLGTVVMGFMLYLVVQDLVELLG